MGIASTFRDVCLAVSALRLLDGDPTVKVVVVAAHNWHIKKAPEHAADGCSIRSDATWPLHSVKAIGRSGLVSVDCTSLIR